MKKKKAVRKQTVKKQKQKKHMSTSLIFLLTLAAVLVVGFLGMLFYALLRGDSFSQSGNTKASELLPFTTAPIPERTEEEPAGEQQEMDQSRYGAILADPAYMEENNIFAKENQKEGVVTIGFAGDILLDDEYAIMANLLRRGVSIENGVSEAALAQMQGMDIMMVNNEFPYTDRGTPTEGKTYTFRADPETVSYLTDMGVDIVSLANNHCFDFGETGLLDTLDTLENAGIPYAGAGRNLEEASRPVYFICGDMKIAILAATQIERLDNPDTRGATAESTGVFRCWNPEGLYEAVKEAKANSDFVIVYIHWGTENETQPDWAQLEQAPEIAAAGADLIIGDHAHCLQGFQYYGDVPVIYSLGNFWFNSRTLDTCILQVTISTEGIQELRFIPAIQQDCRVDLAYGTEKTRIIDYMESISFGVSIDEDGVVSR